MDFNNLVTGYLDQYNEAKEAPKGKHYDSAGRLRSGDADADGRGGPKFRSDPTYVNPNEDGEINTAAAMRTLDRISGQQAADELYGAIHAEVQKGKSVEEVLKDMNYAEKNHRVMVNSYNNWLASKPDVEGAEEDAERVDKDRMKCNSPRRTSGGSKKFVVKACKDGKEKVVRFGDPNMKIKKSNPKRRKSFRARHKCDQKKDKFSAGYWSCKKW